MALTTEKAFSGVHLRKLPQRLPVAARYPKIDVAVPHKRIPSKRRSEQNSYSTNSQEVIRVEFQRDNIYDFRQGYLQFDLTLATTGGTYARIAQGVWSIFDRLKILMGEHEQEDMLAYNRLFSMLWESGQNPDSGATMGRGMMGIGTQIERNALGATTTRYSIPLASGFLNVGVLPLKFMNDKLRLELHMGDPLTYVETDGTSPIITLTGVEMHAHKMKYTQNVELSHFQAGLRGGIDVAFVTYTHYLNNAAGASAQDFKIPHVSDSVNAVHSFFSPSTDNFDPTVNDKFLNWPKSAFTRVHAEVNGELYPEEALEGADANANQIYKEYLKYYGYWKLHGMSQSEPSLDVTSFNSDKWLMILDLRPHLNEALVNPIGLSADSSDLLLKTTFSAPLTNTFMHSFVEHIRFGSLTTVNTLSTRNVPN